MTVAGRKTVRFDALRNRKSERKRGELMKGGAFGALSLIAVLTAVPALATDPAPAAFKTVASQAYVDITRQSTISATSDGTNNTPNYVYNQSTNPNAAGSVVTTTTTAGTVGERGIANAPVSNGSGGYTNGDWLPTVNAMMGAINAHTPTALTWTSTETTAAGNYSTAFDGQTGNWPAADAGKLIDATGLATALSLKQNKITTGLVDYYSIGDDETYQVPSLLSYGTGTNNADGILGNKIGILDWGYISNDGWNYLTSSEMDNFVPTVRAVANSIARLYWNGSNGTAINAYSTAFSSNGANNTWNGNGSYLIDGQFLAYSLALKQNKLPAQDNNLVPGQMVMNGGPSSVIAPTTAGNVTQVALWDADGGDETAWDINTYFSNDEGVTENQRIAIKDSIPTVRAVEAGLNQKQNKITTGLVDYYSGANEETYQVPSLLSYGTGTNNADGILGNKIGILNLGYISTEGWNNLTSSEMDNFVPTVRAVAYFDALKQNNLPARSSGNLAPKGNQAVVLFAAGSPSNVYTTAGKDLALTAKSGAEKVMNYIDGTTASSTFATSQGLTQTKVKAALVSLELLKDVYSELNAKITNNALPTGTTGTVVTYNGTNANTGVQEFTETAIYNTANAYNASTDADKLATAGFVATKQNQIGATTSTYVYDSTNNTTAAGSVVTTTTTAGTVGERGIANAPVSNGSGGYTNGDWLPTVNAMMGAINAHTPTALTWTATETTAAGNYSTAFDGQTGNWPAADADKLIDGTGLATALSNKQNKIVAGNSGDVVTYSGTAGSVGSVAVYNTANAYNASTDANKLATAGFVATKQNQIGATTSTYVYDSTNNTTADGSVVTTNTLGVTGERGIATAPVYTTNNNVTTLTNSSWLPTMGAMMNQINTATATLTWTSTEATAASNYSTSFAGTTGNWPAADADKKVDGTALAAALATKQNKMVCTGWSSDTHTDANCWIWSIE